VRGTPQNKKGRLSRNQQPGPRNAIPRAPPLAFAGRPRCSLLAPYVPLRPCQRAAAACTVPPGYDSLMTETAARRIRVVIAKPGLDGHDRGAKVIARALRDAGMEVIYTGLRQSPEQIVAAAAQEDADVIGLSILSGAHLPICRRVLELLRERGMQEVRVFVGGIIPNQDIQELKQLGVADVFLPGASTQDAVRVIEQCTTARA
jgi:methylmalonyl-CoA mutase C-terminal domain/subunit